MILLPEGFTLSNCLLFLIVVWRWRRAVSNIRVEIEIFRTPLVFTSPSTHLFSPSLSPSAQLSRASRGALDRPTPALKIPSQFTLFSIRARRLAMATNQEVTRGGTDGQPGTVQAVPEVPNAHSSELDGERAAKRLKTDSSAPSLEAVGDDSALCLDKFDDAPSLKHEEPIPSSKPADATSTSGPPPDQIPLPEHSKDESGGGTEAEAPKSNGTNGDTSTAPAAEPRKGTAPIKKE